MVGIEKDDHFYLGREPLEHPHRHRRKPVTFVGHPLKSFEMAAGQVIGHQHQRQQRRTRSRHIQRHGPFSGGGKTRSMERVVGHVTSSGGFPPPSTSETKRKRSRSDKKRCAAYPQSPARNPPCARSMKCTKTPGPPSPRAAPARANED